MTERSYKKFDYALRPAKNIERKMLCEGFSRLSNIAPASGYRYIGFGSVAFLDFALVHQRLGITNMVSIERAEEDRGRFLFNQPFSCITIRWGESSDILPQLSWRSRSIIWLDYDRRLDKEMLGDVATVVANLRSGSIFVLTVDARPGSLDPKRNTGVLRTRELEERVGAKRLPRRIPDDEGQLRPLRGADLAGWGTARACREIIHAEILETLSDRNAAKSRKSHLSYQQLFNFHYADNAKMLTVGGCILNAVDAAKLPMANFADLDYICPGPTPFLIEVPVLTWREANWLNKQLPRSAPEVPKPTWLPEDERRRYGRVYRYFPTYLEAEV